jgi:xylulokinase
MSETYLIGADLGTSSTKSALYTSDGKLVAEASLEVPLYHPRPGVVEQENDDFFQTAASTIRTCIEESGIDPGNIAGIAFDSQMAGIGTVDEDFNPATRFDSWLDMRCEPYIEHIDKQYGDRLTELTGCPPTCDHGPKMLWWKNEEPEAYRRICKFVTPAGYVAGKMCGLKGEDAFMDHTFLHFTGAVDAKKGAWSDELCRELDIDQEKLPRIVSPWEIAGEVTESAAKAFGLNPGTIVAAGCGDTAAGALGGGVVKAGQLFDVAGTASVLAGCTNQFVSDVENKALLTMRSIIPGLWHPLAYIAGGGIALRWFRDEFFNALQGQTQKTADDLYDKMTALAETIPPGSEGLMFSPHLGGRICPATPEMRGAWLGFSWGHKQAHFARSILEGIAYEYAYYLQILKALVPELDLIETRMIGGGARSQVWNQIKADVLGVPTQQLQGSEFGSWGSAMVAGKAAGVFDDLAEVALRTSTPKGHPFSPDPDTHAIYTPLVDQYIRWQTRLAKGFKAEERK